MTGAWILLAAIGTGCVAAWVAHWRQKVRGLLEDPSPAEVAEERRYDRDRYVDLPGYPGPDAGPDIRYATYPPGVLRDHPEPAPDIPGRMSLEDTTDAVRAAIRIAREAAAGREVER
jgi:hypothetical protein